MDYDIWHKRLGHPSQAVLRRAKELKDFLNDLVFPEHSPLCRGCAEGKLHSKSFPESDSRATKLFQIVHSDLKEFPIESYSKYKYLVSFIDDYSSNAWVALLRKKSETLNAFKQFIAMVRTQFKAVVQTLMSDFGGEYKSREFDTFLKDNGIQSRSSVPHMHQQNGRAERFNRTLMDKAQAMRLDACLPPSWWEFAIKTATHLYNRAPV
jgi:transposase InsO family protein